VRREVYDYLNTVFDIQPIVRARWRERRLAEVRKKQGLTVSSFIGSELAKVKSSVVKTCSTIEKSIMIY